MLLAGCTPYSFRFRFDERVEIGLWWDSETQSSSQESGVGGAQRRTGKGKESISLGGLCVPMALAMAESSGVGGNGNEE